MTRSTSWLLALALVGCRPPPDPKPDAPVGASPSSVARIRHEGLFACIPEPARNAAGLPVTCEPSGVAQLGGEIWIANDKPLPGRSPMMQVPLDGDRLGTPSYAEVPSLAGPQKYEDLTAVPSGAGLLAITGFDRVGAGTSAMDAYNVLLWWTPQTEPTLVRASTRDGVTSSVALREQIATALVDERFPRGPPYFKLEGLALLPDGRLLLGVRELGRSWQQPVFVVKILQTRWSADAPGDLATPLTLAWSFDPAAQTNIPQRLGLSGLAWDGRRDRLLLSTSYELGLTEADLGAYLWTLPLADYEAGAPPGPVRNPDGTRLHLSHKAEGIEVLGDGRVLVVHDDDRTTGRGPGFQRGLQQAAYVVLDITD